MKATTDRLAGLSADEKRALLASLVKARAAEAAEPAYRLISAQAARAPSSIAVSGEGRSLSYRELEDQSDRIARRLRAMGVGPDVLVGLCVERSPTMVVAMLGILKAGGAYVPIDPGYPESRVALMVEDSGLRFLLTEQSLREGIPSGDARVSCLDSEWDGWDDDPSPAAESPVAPENLAYVIYTSGSTGRPKGVAIPHGALSNFLGSMKAILGIGEHDALLAVTTLSFDIAGLELLLPLTVGARVEIASRGLATDGPRLAARLAEGDITVFQATPATWRMILDGGWPGRGDLTMLCGGEAMPPSLAERLAGKGKALWNLYGPTETTIWSSAAKIESTGASITIGSPIARTQLHVLDSRLRAVPSGVTGELYIGGRGVARGYLGRADLTAERFVPDPFSKVPGARLYRTGDLARRRPDGALECLGRVDQQVKIRGFRVELGEVESALMRHPAIREAAAAARPDPSGENALVGYASIRAGESLDVAALRLWLAQSVPDYMVPSAFVVLDALPQTPNGKIDRNALPDPEPAARISAEGYVPPRGPVEEALAEAWAQILGVPRVGIRDNFFDLGGHSLSATQVVARIRDTFDVEPPLKDFFDDATVANLALLVERAMTSAAGVTLPPVQKADRSASMLASFAQQRLWFLDQLDPGSPAYNIPSAVRLRGKLDRGALHRALAEIVRRHESLRTTFANRGGVPIQVIADAAELPLPVDDLTAVAGADREAELARRLRDEATAPFDLARGPLIRVRLMVLADDDHVVAATMHHIISDGWSIGVLIREVAVLYDAFHSGEASPLPDPPLQYADYSAWQRAWLDGDSLDTQVAYWKARLTGIPPLDLPTDRPRPPVMTHRGGGRTIAILKGPFDGLKTLARKSGATLYMAGLAAFEILLHRYTGQDVFAVGSPIAGRTRSEWEPLIGFFANTLALRCDLSGDPSVREAIARARSEALGAYAHQDVPFDRLVAAVDAGRDPSRSPVFQAMFVLQNAPMPIPGSDEMAIELLESDSGTAKFDLILYLTETADGAVATLEYAADLFDASTADRMLGHFLAIVREMVADPDQAVGAIAMMTEAERSALGDEDEWGDLSDEELASLMAETHAEGPPVDA